MQEREREQIYRSLKVCCSIIFAAAFVLELLPRSLFTSDLPNSVLKYLVKQHNWWAHLQRDAESAYRGYGNKFALSYFIMITTFLAVTFYLVLMTLRRNVKGHANMTQSEKKSHWLLIVAIAIIVLQLSWPSLYLSHTKAGALPFLNQALFWSSADWLIVAYLSEEPKVS